MLDIKMLRILMKIVWILILMIMMTLVWPWCLSMVIWYVPCGRPGWEATRFILWPVLQNIHPRWYFQNAWYNCVIHLIWGFNCDKCCNKFTWLIFSKHTCSRNAFTSDGVLKRHILDTLGENSQLHVFTCIKSSCIYLIFLRCVCSDVSSKNFGQSK